MELCNVSMALCWCSTCVVTEYTYENSVVIVTRDSQTSIRETYWFRSVGHAVAKC